MAYGRSHSLSAIAARIPPRGDSSRTPAARNDNAAQYREGRAVFVRKRMPVWGMRHTRAVRKFCSVGARGVMSPAAIGCVFLLTAVGCSSQTEAVGPIGGSGKTDVATRYFGGDPDVAVRL